MSDSFSARGNQELPPPLRFIGGFFQVGVGVVLSVFGSVFKVFPLTSALGSPILKLAYKLSFDGGANIVGGLKGTFGMAGRAMKSDPKQETPELEPASTERLFPPAS